MSGQSLLLGDEMVLGLSLSANQEGKARYGNQGLREITDNRQAVELPDQRRGAQALDRDPCALSLSRRVETGQDVDFITPPTSQKRKKSSQTPLIRLALQDCFVCVPDEFAVVILQQVVNVVMVIRGGFKLGLQAKTREFSSNG